MSFDRILFVIFYLKRMGTNDDERQRTLQDSGAECVPVCQCLFPLLFSTFERKNDVEGLRTLQHVFIPAHTPAH